MNFHIRINYGDNPASAFPDDSLRKRASASASCDNHTLFHDFPSYCIYYFIRVSEPNVFG